MINIAGIISVILFYILILAVGVWASRKQSGVEGVDQEVVFDEYPELNQYTGANQKCITVTYLKPTQL